MAHRFVSGDDTCHVEALRDALAELVSEVQARFSRMATLSDEVCPESKITPELSRNPDLDMPITAVVIDEVQVFLEWGSWTGLTTSHCDPEADHSSES